MEENNLNFTLGGSSPSNSSYLFDPSFAIPSTNGSSKPFCGSIIPPPAMDPSNQTIQNSPPPPATSILHPFLMENNHTALNLIDFTPAPSLSSLLRTNDLNAPIDHFPNTNQMLAIYANSSNMPLTPFPSPSLQIENNKYMYNFQMEAPQESHLQSLPWSANRSILGNEAPYNIGHVENNKYMYNFQMEAPQKSHLQSLPWSANRSILGNEAPYNIGHGLSNPYNPNFLYSMGNTNIDINRQHPSLQESTRFRCSTCHADFPTAQAYGGHMSSHSKARKAQAKMEAAMREAKRARLAMGTYPFLDLSMRASASVANVNEKERKTSEEKNVEWKGKHIVERPLKEAEEIQMEVPGYVSDESGNSEFLLKRKR